MTQITGTELRARREALSFAQVAFAQHLKVPSKTLNRWETGRSKIPPGVAAELELLEDALESLVERMLDEVEDSPPDVVLMTHVDDAAFWAVHPEHEGLPSIIHRVACARVAAMLRAEDGPDLRIMSVADIP